MQTTVLRAISGAAVLLVMIIAFPAGVCAEQVTFSGQIAKIVYDKCSACHRPGQPGPFELLTYEDVSKRAETIEAVIDSGYMPPWKPKHTGIEFANNRQLTNKETEQLKKWIAVGCPEGDRTQTPAAPIYPDGWSLGTPDLVVKMDEAFDIPASGPDLYRSFVLPVNLPDDQWVKAIELRPTERGAIHHALFFIDDSGKAKGLRERNGQAGVRGMNFLRGLGGEALERGPDRLARGLGGYVPGAVPNRLPGDLAKFLPRNSDVIMQTHFHPSGKPEREQAELGLYFTEQAPSHLLVPIQLPPLFGIGAGIDVPAGEANYRVADSYTLPIDVRGIEIGGHAHYICREMLMTAKLPGGDKLELLRIDDWDLDWQDQYAFAKPVDLPRGTEISVTLVYDNSSNNPENPFNPPRRISWGRESTDEMGSVTLQVVAVDESQRSKLEDDVRERTRESIRKRVQAQTSGLAAIAGGTLGSGTLVKVFDSNRDGKLQSDELPERFRERLLEFIDTNGDEVLDAQELEKSRTSMERFMKRKN